MQLELRLCHDLDPMDDDPMLIWILELLERDILTNPEKTLTRGFRHRTVMRLVPDSRIMAPQRSEAGRTHFHLARGDASRTLRGLKSAGFSSSELHCA